MDAPRKDATLELLRAVVDETSPVHSPDGWWCELDSTACGATIEALCRCCVTAMEARVRVAPDLGGEG